MALSKKERHDMSLLKKKAIEIHMERNALYEKLEKEEKVLFNRLDVIDKAMRVFAPRKWRELNKTPESKIMLVED